MSNWFYGICLFLACLAAGMLGYAVGSWMDCSDPAESLITRERVTDIFTVEQYGPEAQGTYLSINDRMMKEERHE